MVEEKKKEVSKCIFAKKFGEKAFACSDHFFGSDSVAEEVCSECEKYCDNMIDYTRRLANDNNNKP
jgi:hypothetical protein